MARRQSSPAADYEGVYRKYVGPWFGWTSLRYYSPYVWSYQHFCRQEAEEQAGVRIMPHGTDARSPLPSTPRRRRYNHVM